MGCKSQFLLVLSCAKASKTQEFICWCQQEITDLMKRGSRTWTDVLARDQQAASENQPADSSLFQLLRDVTAGNMDSWELTVPSVVRKSS